MAGAISMNLNKDDPMQSMQGYDAEQVTMNDDDSMESRISKIITSGSPLMQSATTSATRAQNRRGTLGSSMHTGAIAAEMVDRAAPIAEVDSGRSLQNKQFNTTNTNDAFRFNADSYNKGASQLSSEANALKQITTSGDQQRQTATTQGAIETSLIGARGDQDVRSIGAQGDVQSRLQKERGDIDLKLQTADAATRTALLNRQGEIDRDLQTLRGQQNIEGIEAQTDSESRLAGERADYEYLLQQLRGDQSAALQQIEEQSANLRQASQSAAQFFSYHTAAMSQILAEPEISPETKQQLINKQTEMLENGLAVIGAASNLNLTDLLQFGAPALTGSGTDTKGAGQTTGTGSTTYVPPARTTTPTTTTTTPVSGIENLPPSTQAQIQSSINQVQKAFTESDGSLAAIDKRNMDFYNIARTYGLTVEGFAKLSNRTPAEITAWLQSKNLTLTGSPPATSTPATTQTPATQTTAPPAQTSAPVTTQPATTPPSTTTGAIASNSAQQPAGPNIDPATNTFYLNGGSWDELAANEGVSVAELQEMLKAAGYAIK